jgi:hypothetical protein
MLYWNEIINDLTKILISIQQSNSVPNKPEHTLVNTCNSWRGSDVTKECLETNFHLSSTLLRKLCVHYANSFYNVESVYFFYSNPVHRKRLPMFLRFAQDQGAQICSKWNTKSFGTILSAYSHVSLPGSNLDLVTSFPTGRDSSVGTATGYRIESQ